MAEFPSFPLWVQRYKADTEHLSYEEHGIYLNVLMVMWITPGQRLPNDDAWIERRFGLPIEKIRPLLMEFCQSDGNWITQKCLLKEWEKVRAITSKRRAAAKSRWNKEKNPFTCNAGMHMPSNAPTPTPTPTPIVKKVSKKDSGKHLLPDSWEPLQSHFEHATKKGLSIEEVNDAALEMRSWSLGNGEKRDRWDFVFTNWLSRKAERKLKSNGPRLNGNGLAATKNPVIATIDRAIAKIRDDRVRAGEGFGDDGLFQEGRAARSGEIPARFGGNLIPLPKRSD